MSCLLSAHSVFAHIALVLIVTQLKKVFSKALSPRPSFHLSSGLAKQLGCSEKISTCRTSLKLLFDQLQQDQLWLVKPRVFFILRSFITLPLALWGQVTSRVNPFSLCLMNLTCSHSIETRRCCITCLMWHSRLRPQSVSSASRVDWWVGFEHNTLKILALLDGPEKLNWDNEGEIVMLEMIRKSGCCSSCTIQDVCK